MSEFPDVTLAQWRQRVRRELDGADPDSLGSETACGQHLQPLYVDAPGSPRLPPLPQAGPRHAPGPGWRRCQRYEDPDAGVAADQIGVDVAGGIDSVWLRFDRAARQGLDPGAEESALEVGAEGIAVWDVESLLPLLQAAAAAGRELWIDAGGNALPAAALTIAGLERTGVDPAELCLRFCADPLAALAADGSIPADHATLGWEGAVLAATCTRRWEHARSFVVSTAPYARAGASVALGLGVALATAAQYLRYLAAAGVAPRTGVEQLAFQLETDRDFLVEVAMLRALRLAWNKVQRACDLPPSTCRVHAVSGWRTAARRDPWVNMLRASVQAAAAAVGGADTITAIAYDAACGRPRARGWRVARNTQAVLREECHLGEVHDPAAGSAAVETLTDQLARGAWDALRRIDSRGMAAMLQPQSIDTILADPLAAAARERRRRIVEGEESVVGVSVFAVADVPAPQRQAPDLPAIRARVRERLAGRDAPDQELSRVAQMSRQPMAEQGPEPLFDALLQAARAGATLHEIGVALRPQAAPQRTRPLRPWRDADACEVRR